MRFKRQPVAAGGNEVWLVEAASRLETLEPFTPRCHLVFPQPFRPFPLTGAKPKVAGPRLLGLVRGQILKRRLLSRRCVVPRSLRASRRSSPQRSARRDRAPTRSAAP